MSALTQPRTLLALAAALMVAACGGGGGGSSGPSTVTLSGAAIKGPLESARACPDYNGNGACDTGTEMDASQLTDATGKFTLTLSTSAPILVISEAGTKDTVSNASVPVGTVLKAPAGATVVSMATTLLAADPTLTNEQVGRALGLTGVTDFKTYNPFAGTDDAKKLAFEKASLPVYSLVSAVTSAAEGAGIDRAKALSGVLQSLATSAAVAMNAIDFSNSTVVGNILSAVEAKLPSADQSSFSTKVLPASAELSRAVANVASQVATVSSLSNSDSKALFAVATNALADDAKNRVALNTPISLAAQTPQDLQDALALAKKAALPPSTSLSLASIVGLWRSASGADTMSMVIRSDGKAWATRIQSDVTSVVRVPWQVTGGLYSAFAEVTPSDNASTLPVGMKATASVGDDGRLTGTLTPLIGSTVSLNLGLQSNAYASSAVATDFAKTWGGSVGNRTVSWTVNAQGVLSGNVAETGCAYAGKLESILNGIALASITEECSGTSKVTLSGAALLDVDKAGLTLLLQSAGKPIIVKLTTPNS